MEPIKMQCMLILMKVLEILPGKCDMVVSYLRELLSEHVYLLSRNKEQDLTCQVETMNVIGSVIGKGGKVINSIRQETHAKIKVVDPFPGAQKRVMNIYCFVKDKEQVDADDEITEPLCPAQDALLRVHTAIPNALSNTKDADEDVNEEEPSLKIIMEGYNNCKISFISLSYNFKYYGRFQMALQTESDFVYIVDDDMIPGKKMLEILAHVGSTEKYKNSVLGSIGMILPFRKKDFTFPSYRKLRTKEVGLYLPDHAYGITVDRIVQVDFLSSSWFLSSKSCQDIICGDSFHFHHWRRSASQTINNENATSKKQHNMAEGGSPTIDRPGFVSGSGVLVGHRPPEDGRHSRRQEPRGSVVGEPAVVDCHYYEKTQQRRFLARCRHVLSFAPLSGEGFVGMERSRRSRRKDGESQSPRGRATLSPRDWLHNKFSGSYRQQHPLSSGISDRIQLLSPTSIITGPTIQNNSAATCNARKLVFHTTNSSLGAIAVGLIHQNEAKAKIWVDWSTLVLSLGDTDCR
ncbi:KH domain-containing protein [Platanthera guangdongensis]|uniref:KH domain-containing protein n=1 Tax=Platanthera guangdongensis TaxID=2320717 RepID=A0ABR2MER1_9ASPA